VRDAKTSVVRPPGLIGWFIVGTLAGLAVVGFFTGLVLLIPAVALGGFLSDRGFKGGWLAVSGFGAGVMILLLDDLSDGTACDDWVGQSCRGIDKNAPRVAFFVGVALVVAGIVATVIATRRARPDDELRF
jgi:hypothetical protein